MKSIACLALLAACTFPRPDDVTFGESAITIVDGDHQTGVVDTSLPVQLKVNVTDADFIPIPNFTVEFSVRDDNGTVTRTVLTDAQGNARAEMKLGTRAGEQIVDVWGEGIEGDEPVFFTATALADVPAKISAFAGDGESATVATQLAAPLVARVEDRFGNPSPAGLDVTFAVTSGGGSLSTNSATSGADGTASTQLTLGTVAGAHTVDASAEGVAGTTFTISGLADAPATIERTSPETLLAEALQPSEPMIVTARDVHGNPVPGATITFTKTGAGTGTIPSPTVITDANGQAAGSIVAASFTGTNTVKATAGFTATEINFTASTRSVRSAQSFSIPTKQGDHVAVGDVNMDGLADIVALSSATPTTGMSGFTVYLNTTTPGAAIATFDTGTGFATTITINSTTSISLTDATGDGVPDVVVSNSSGAIHPNTTTPGATTPAFGSPASLSGSAYGKAHAVDMNGDQLLDIVLSGTNQSSSVRICRRTGAAFSFQCAPHMNTYFERPYVDDIDGDGKPDVTFLYSGTLYAHSNTSTAGGTVTFGTPTTMATGMTMGALADVDGDMKRDWVLGNASTLRIMRNTTSTATPAFTALPDISASPGIYHFAPVDLNRDGLLDLVGSTSTTMVAMLNTGTASAPAFAAPVALPAAVSYPLLTIADFNKDGRPDFLINATGTDVQLILAR